jgi:DNA-binding NarL/FixJ family response regulator
MQLIQNQSNQEINLIRQLINNITEDEDHRQDLWVCYLSGSEPETLSNSLEKIALNNEIYAKFVVSFQEFYKNPPSPEFLNKLSKLTPLEQSICMLIMLGLSIDQISSYRGITPVRVKQIISTIGDKKGVLDGFEEEIFR